MGWMNHKGLMWGDEPQDDVDEFVDKIIGKDEHMRILSGGSYIEKGKALSKVRGARGIDGVRKKIDAMYIQKFGRKASEMEWKHLLRFSLGLKG